MGTGTGTGIVAGILHEEKYEFLIISRPVLLRMRNISDINCRENQNTQFMFHNRFSKVVPFKVNKYGRTGQTTDDNMGHALCMLEN